MLRLGTTARGTHFHACAPSLMHCCWRPHAGWHVIAALGRTTRGTHFHACVAASLTHRCWRPHAGVHVVSAALAWGTAWHVALKSGMTVQRWPLGQARPPSARQGLRRQVPPRQAWPAWHMGVATSQAWPRVPGGGGDGRSKLPWPVGSGTHVQQPSSPRPLLKPAAQSKDKGPALQLRWQKAQRGEPSADVAHLEVAAAQQRCWPSAGPHISCVLLHVAIVSGGCVGGGSWAVAVARTAANTTARRRRDADMACATWVLEVLGAFLQACEGTGTERVLCVGGLRKHRGRPGGACKACACPPEAFESRRQAARGPDPKTHDWNAGWGGVCGGVCSWTIDGVKVKLWECGATEE